MSDTDGQSWGDGPSLCPGCFKEGGDLTRDLTLTLALALTGGGGWGRHSPCPQPALLTVPSGTLYKQIPCPVPSLPISRPPLPGLCCRSLTPLGKHQTPSYKDQRPGVWLQ